MKKSLLAFLLILLLLPLQARAEELEFQITRIAGENRYDTAIEISKVTHAKSKTAIIANGETFPDALAGGPLAVTLNAPILLTPKDSLDLSLIKRLTEMDPDQIIILGSYGSVSKRIENGLEAIASVSRIGGENRYETAAMIAERVQQISGSTEVALASGLDFPDALSSTALVANREIPIVLTGKTLDRASRSFLNNGVTNKIYILGGPKSVSNEIENSLKNTVRIAGQNRYETAIKFAKMGIEKPEYLALVNGSSFPDALAAVSLTNTMNAPLVLTEKDTLPKDLVDYIMGQKIKKIVLVGGKSNLSADLIGKIVDLMGDGKKIQEEPVFTKNTFNKDYARKTLDAINATRKEKNLYAYTWDEGLAKAAETRAKELVQKFEHTRPDGSPWNSVSQYAKGENLIILNVFPNQVVDALLKLQGDKGNILRERSDFKAMGAGCWVNDEGLAHWVLIFGMPSK